MFVAGKIEQRPRCHLQLLAALLLVLLVLFSAHCRGGGQKTPGETVGENVTTPAEVFREPGKEIEDKVAIAAQTHSQAVKIPVVPAAEQKPTVDVTRETAFLRDRLGYLVERNLLEIHQRGPATVLVLSNTQLFASGQTRLSAAGRRLVLQINETLLGLRGKRFQIEGHADDRPARGRVSNWDLGFRRAMAVTELMISNNMPSYRISASSYGSTRPQENLTSADKALNRRVEIAIYDDHYQFAQDADQGQRGFLYKTIDPARTGPDGRTPETEYQRYLREREIFLKRQGK